MTVLLFSFSNYAKSFAGRFKDFHLGKAYRDVRQIIIKKVPHRMKQFTLSPTSKGASSPIVFLCEFLQHNPEAAQAEASQVKRRQSHFAALEQAIA